MPKNNQRLRVWKGELRKTTGGLTKDDLMKNNKGKIVSKRKSLAMKKINNLGGYLREKGQPFKMDKKPEAAKKEVPAKKPEPAKKKETKVKKAPAKKKVKVVKTPDKLKTMLKKVVKKGKKQQRAARKDVAAPRRSSRLRGKKVDYKPADYSAYF